MSFVIASSGIWGVYETCLCWFLLTTRECGKIPQSVQPRIVPLRQNLGRKPPGHFLFWPNLSWWRKTHTHDCFCTHKEGWLEKAQLEARRGPGDGRIESPECKASCLVYWQAFPNILLLALQSCNSSYLFRSCLLWSPNGRQHGILERALD